MRSASPGASGSSLGIDLGGTYLKWEHLTAEGVRTASGRVPTPITGHLAVARALCAVITSRLDGGITDVGIAVPGHLTSDRDSITLLPNVAGEWKGFAVREFIHERTGIMPVLLNDARAFALAELELGAGEGESNVVFTTIGTGVGGAVAVDGRLVTSGRDNFGEVGHTTAVVDGERCGCGSLGCVEAYAGGSALLRHAAERGVAVVPGAKALITLAALASQNPAARSVLDEAFDAFAVGVASVCGFTGSSVVVVGGAVASELPGYLDRARQRLDARAGLIGTVEVRPARLGSRAGALGAALAARRPGSGSRHARSADPQTARDDDLGPQRGTQTDQRELEHHA